jgi:hypothetical protein
MPFATSVTTDATASSSRDGTSYDTSISATYALATGSRTATRATGVYGTESTDGTKAELSGYGTTKTVSAAGSARSATGCADLLDMGLDHKTQELINDHQ